MTARRSAHGEADYEASRRYNDATKRFVDSGRVEQGARDAAPRTPEEAAQLQRSERAALLRAREKASPADGPAGLAAGIPEPQQDPNFPDEVDAGVPRRR